MSILNQLAVEISTMIGIQGPLSDEEFAHTEEFTVKYAR